MELSDEFIKTLLNTLRDIGTRLSAVEEKLSLDAETVEENSEHTPVFHNIETNIESTDFKKTQVNKSLDNAVEMAILHYKKIPPKRRFNN